LVRKGDTHPPKEKEKKERKVLDSVVGGDGCMYVSQAEFCTKILEILCAIFPSSERSFGHLTMLSHVYHQNWREFS